VTSDGAARPLYLVRHGESEWNVQRRTQGQTMAPRLTARGRRQAHGTAARIARDLARLSLVADAVVTSDLVRAVETATIVAGVLGCAVREDERLREQHLGALEGRSYEETFAVAAAVDGTDPDHPVGGGESVRQVRERMAAALAALDPGLTTVVVTHGDALRAALAHLQGHEPHRAPWVEVPNGAVVRVDRGRGISWIPALGRPGGASDGS
jgi:probable phosphoglycerate mutase